VGEDRQGGAPQRRIGDRVREDVGTLAAAHAEAGEFDEAVKWQTKALELAPDSMKAGMKARFELYQQGKPFRE